MKHLAVLLCALFFAAVAASTADARDKRSCDARLFLVVKGPGNYETREDTLDRFSATASCPEGWGDTCRDRARQKAVACLDAAWSRRWDRNVPHACKWEQGVKDYTTSNLKCDLFRKMCAIARNLPRNQLDPVEAVVKGEVSGQTGHCTVSNRELGEYVVEDCNTFNTGVEAEHCSLPASTGRLAAEEGTDRPGLDYFSYEGGTLAQCSRRCSQEAKCKAYTWVKPGFQGPRSRCWLKNKVPVPVPSNCCVSGVK